MYALGKVLVSFVLAQVRKRQNRNRLFREKLLRRRSRCLSQPGNMIEDVAEHEGHHYCTGNGAKPKRLRFAWRRAVLERWCACEFEFIGQFAVSQLVRVKIY